MAVAAWRAAIHAAWRAGDPSPSEVGHRPVQVGGVRCLQSGSADSAPLLVYVHGGGYALGSPEVALPITSRLADGFDLLSVDYRLAPEHPHPAAVADCTAVVRAAAASRPRLPFALVGDSAGANLVVATAVGLRAGGQRGPAALALLSAHLDHSGTARGSDDTGTQHLDDVDRRADEWLSAAYCGDIERTDPAVSPLHADLTGLPPTLVQVADTERLLPHSVRFARLARLAGVEVTLDVWDGLWHTWHYHRDLPEADRALAEVRAFLHAQLDRIEPT